jgi:hypothetical protein
LHLKPIASALVSGATPIDKVAERLKLNDRLENKLYKPPADQNDLLNK